MPRLSRFEYDRADYVATMAQAGRDRRFSSGFDAAAQRQKARGENCAVWGELLHRGMRQSRPSNLVGQLRAAVCMNPHRAGQCDACGERQPATGQGHETRSLGVAEMIGIPENVEIVHGDTRIPNSGMGTYGSRSLAVGGSAMVRATEKLSPRPKRIARIC